LEELASTAQHTTRLTGEKLKPMMVGEIDARGDHGQPSLGAADGGRLDRLGGYRRRPFVRTSSVQDR
jgi:hypothetical protein